MSSKKPKKPSLQQRWPELSAGQKISEVIILLLEVAGALILLCGVVIIAVVIVFDVQQHHAQQVQNRKYAQAEARCHAKPVVVVRSQVLEDTTTTIYAPGYAGYEANKAVHSTDLFGDTYVVGYYCTLQAAQAAYPSASL